MARIVVVGGGHAGIEAAHASARLGVSTLLVTINLDQIGQLSCNPSIGGVGKGHIVREIDALGGRMGRLADASCIHFRILNASRGMAVRGPRAQADRYLYRSSARRMLESTPNLKLLQGLVTGLQFTKERVSGVELQDGSQIACDAVVLTAGTFLRGVILFGDRRIPSGRAGEPPAEVLADQLRNLGFLTRRLKTGTSPRIAASSIDFSRMTEQPGDEKPAGFSFFGPRPSLPQVSCHLVHTNEATRHLVQEHLHRSAMYGGHVEGVGPRYCPSIEDKFVKFPEKLTHQVFVEPDSLQTDEIYLAGLSTSLPVDVQQHLVRTLPGFEAAEVVRPGYAIEYDAYDPLQLNPSLEVKDFKGLWFAGQVNGTTGYEEAAGQGLMAGINAARAMDEREPIVLGRSQAYLGVMLDDLVTKGVDEPYRMLTSRAEHRLELACDTADTRLLPLAVEIGLLTEEEATLIQTRRDRRSRFREEWENIRVTPSSDLGRIATEAGVTLAGGVTLMQLLARQAITGEWADRILGSVPGWRDSTQEWDPILERELAIFEIRYASLREREARLLSSATRWDHVQIPVDFRVEAVPGLSNEVREKLLRHKPGTLGQAARIPGITPAAVTLLHLLIERRD